MHARGHLRKTLIASFMSLWPLVCLQFSVLSFRFRTFGVSVNWRQESFGIFRANSSKCHMQMDHQIKDQHNRRMKKKTRKNSSSIRISHMPRFPDHSARFCASASVPCVPARQLNLKWFHLSVASVLFKMWQRSGKDTLTHTRTRTHASHWRHLVPGACQEWFE